MASRLVILFAIVVLAQCKLLDLSCKNVRKFVDGHNSKRLELAKGEVTDQPPAGKMKSMIWDEELAAKAASWVSQNPSGHNPDRTVPSGKFTTGENIYWYWTTAPSYKLDPNSAIQSWFDEHKDYSYGPLKGSDFASSKEIGHYTQMIWSDSTHVGCAIARGHDGSWTKFTVVCNYGPAGNMIGETPYSAAKRGSGKLTCGAGDCSQPYGHKC